MGENANTEMSGACAQKNECTKTYCCEAASRGMPCECPRGGDNSACRPGGNYGGGECRSGRMGNNCPSGGNYGAGACASSGAGSNCASGGNACAGGMGGQYGESHEEMIMGMANHAWKELIIEKMKQAYEKKSGKQMDKIAEVGVEYCIRFWASRMEHKKMKMKGREAKMREMDEYGEKLMEAFMSK